MDEAAGFRSEVWRENLAHPTVDEHWAPLRYQDRLGELDVPVLHVSGCGTTTSRSAPRATSPRWSPAGRRAAAAHGPVGPRGQHHQDVGEVDFGPDSLIDLEAYWLRWLDAQLDGGPWDDAPVRAFVMGRNEWRDLPSWPPAEMELRPLRLRSDGAANSRLGDGRLTWDPPDVDEPDDAYDAAPERPAPFITGITSAQLGGPDDYAAVELRGDVLVYTSDELAEPLQLVGPVTLVLHATSSAPDTDFTGKLLDVHPSGFAQRLCDGLVRARFREGTDVERLLERGRAYAYEIDLWHTAHVFAPGHRLRAEVASSAFPKCDRNLNTGEPLATGHPHGRRPPARPPRRRTAVAHQRVHHDAARPSHLLCPVVPLPD